VYSNTLSFSAVFFSALFFCSALLFRIAGGAALFAVSACGNSTAQRPTGVAAVETAEPTPVVAPREADHAPIELRFVGDVIFGRFRKAGYSPINKPGFSLFEQVKPLLVADLSVANLETPLVRRLPRAVPKPGFFFGAPAEAAEELRAAGFHAVTLSNNHAADMGRAGLIETPLILEEHGILPIGRARVRGQEVTHESFEVRGFRIALIGATTQLNFPLPASFPVVPLAPTKQLPMRLGALIRSVEATHDLTVVLLHWGAEYVPRAHPAQRRAAHQIVELGADLVIGHHPHVLGELEVHDHALVAYSLGNFLFENLNPLPRLSAVLSVSLKGERYCEVEVRVHPIELVAIPTYHPTSADARSAAAIHRLLRPAGRDDAWRVESGTLSTHYRRCP
jgi:poly-gamma-glutamate synthesis protein (capsule biosynthesis protein)